MLQPKLAAERKVSFERDGLDASKACHIFAKGNVRGRVAGSGSGARSGEPVEVLSALSSLSTVRHEWFVPTSWSEWPESPGR
jgi:hypothetical protein